MNGIKFNGQHSFADFGLILTHYAASSPQVKKQTIEIAGRDGALDMTEYFGGVKFSNRQLDFTFVLPNVSAADFSAKMSLLQDKLHGVQVRVEPDIEPLYYYEGRAEVSGDQNRATAEFQIVVDAKPYKMKKVATIANFSVSGALQITLMNSRLEVVPKITTSASMTIQQGGKTWAIPAGVATLPDLILAEGENVLTITGTGNISFEYREGRL